MDIIVIGVLALLAGLAIFRAVKHFGGGGCCGSGSTTIRDNKTLSAPPIGQKVLTIEGMSCVNCEIRVENALGRLENVAAKVSRRKKSAVVSYSAEVSDEVLKATVEKLGYTVTDIR